MIKSKKRKGETEIGSLIAATTANPASAVQAATIVHLTDLHCGGATTEDLVQVIARMEREKAKLVVVTGDVVNCGMQTYLDYDRPEVLDYDVAGVLIRKDWFVIPGNHEYAWTGYAAAAAFEMRAGVRHGVREVAGWRFIGVDFGVPYMQDAFIDPAELQWLEHALFDAHGAPCVLCLHHPPFLPGVISILNQEQLIPLLVKYPVRLILAGHTHKNDIYIAHGVPVVVTDTALSGWYSVVTVQGNKLDIVTKNVLRPELPRISFSIYDAQGRLDPQGVITKAVETPAESPSPAPSAYAVYKVEATATYVPPVRKNEFLYFSNSLGHRWELRLPPAGQRFSPELFRASLRKIGDFRGTMAFTFFDSEGRPCSLSDQGQLLFPGEETDLNRAISCQPIVHGETLVIGTLAGTVLFYDLKNRGIRREIDLHTAMSVASLAADQNGIYICSMDETIRSLGWGGTVRWTTRLTSRDYSFSVFPSSPLVYNDILYVTSNDNKVLAFATRDGAELWEQAMEQCSTFTPILLNYRDSTRERIVVGSRLGVVAAFNPRTGEKTILWNSPKQQILTGAIHDETVFLNCWNGAVVQCGGKAVREWAYALPEHCTRHTPIPLDKEILLPSWNGTFLSFPLE